MASEQSSDVADLQKQMAALQAKLDVAQGGAATAPVHPYSASYKRTAITKIISAADGGASLAGTTLTTGGWVKSGRSGGGGAFAFISINDGSCFDDLQVMVPKEVVEEAGIFKDMQKTGASLLVEGHLELTPEGTKQAVELKVTRVAHFGSCDSSTYPMAKKRHTLEYLREKAHLRPRTNLIGCVARVRNALAFATHSFFQEQGFVYVHTPLLTASDCEGAGEMFQVTTLLGKLEETGMEKQATVTPEELAAAQGDETAQGDAIRSLKEKGKASSDSAEKQAINAEVQAAVNTLKQMKIKTAAIQEQLSFVGGIKRLEDGISIDYSRDFFGKPAYLTVSGQLNGEYYASALSNIYTFGPTFRAENSHTGRHLSEFWMIEPEMAFCDLTDNMRCAEDYVQYCCRHLLEHCASDVAFLDGRADAEKLERPSERLQHVAATPFKRLSYTEAITVLQEAVAGGKAFENEVEWGIDLASEHERYLCEQVYKQPTIVYDYPMEIKAFYMKLNEDGKTVRAMDVLVPGVGELIGGSQREDHLEALVKRLEDSGQDLAHYEGYLDLRKYGSVPHSGFGLGFERLIMFATGVANIRDVIPFPRWPGNVLY